MAKQFVHILITATYEAKDPIPSCVINREVQDINSLRKHTTLQNMITYQMAYPIRPTDCGLKDVWDKMDRYEREEFAESYPQLATAIALMCGGDDGEEQVRNQEDGNRIDPTQSGH
jgi:hypothetical protein